MVEVAIGEAHAGHRAAETALIVLVEVEAGLERQPLDRRTNRFTMNLQRIAGKPHIAGRTRAGELHGADRPAILEHLAGAAGTIETIERENLAVDEFAGLIDRHGRGQHGRRHRGCKNGSQYETRNHMKTPTN